MSTVFRLSDAKLFLPYRIVNCTLNFVAKCRYAEMGLFVGSVVKVLKIAPLGCPLEVEVLDYKLCLRLKEAQGFEVEQVDAGNRERQ